MRLELGELARAVDSSATVADLAVSDWSVDSRTIGPGALFFALRGPNHDGHEHVAEAFEKGAVAAVVERPLRAAGPLIRVEDSHAALAGAARLARSRFAGDVVAVTGSAGKTTTKDAIAALLGAVMPVGKTVGNLNNHVGLPLSILRLPEQARLAVVEIGMNHPGEIRELAGIARPTLGVVTNVGYAHMEFFDSLDGVAASKRELIEALPAQGTAVLNADDDRVVAFRQVHPGPSITFGFHPQAGVRAEQLELTPEGARFRVGDAGFETVLAGRHGVLAVLAGLAVARARGIAPAHLVDAVRTLAPGNMRGERFTRRGVTVYNDCYNSNPDAVRSMLDVLRAEPARRRIAVLGEMLELGRWSESLHRGVGDYAAQCEISVLVGIRGAARHIVEAALDAGLKASAAYFFEDPRAAGDFLRNEARAGDAILFKGSRGVRVEIALERFLE